MQIATSLNLLMRAPHGVDEAIRRVAAAGFEALDFNYVDYQKELLAKTWADEEPWMHQVRAAADTAGVPFVQAHGPMFNKLDRGEAYEAWVALSLRSLRSAAILGLKWVVFEPDTAPGEFDADHLRALREANAEFVRRLLPTAEATDVGIALENVFDTAAASRKARRWYGSEPAELIDLVDTLDHPLIGACWDTGHAQIQGLDQGEALRALGSRLKALHIQDNDGRADQHLLPYSGRVDWPAIMAALRSIHFAGPFTYETHQAFHPLPDPLRDDALRYAVEIARYLVSQP